MICQICKKDYNPDTGAFTRHIKKTHHLSIEDYYEKYVTKSKGICSCGKPTKFLSIQKGYAVYCSNKCSNNSEDVKNKKKEAYLEKYGVENPNQTQEIIEKRRNTSLEKYGKSHWLKTKEIQEKQKETCRNKYGVDNVSQLNDVVDKANKTKSLQYFDIITNSEKFKEKVIPLFTENDYKNTDYWNRYKFKCVECDMIFEDHLYSGHIPRCPNCYPPLAGTSQTEQEVIDFCKEYYPNLIENDRDVLDGKELDVYISEVNLAIEFDGIWWHSELCGIDSTYHIEKTKKCQEKGIQLIHIFENEWNDKKDIVKSILLSKMGKISRKIYARKCIIREVSNQESRDFLFENHLQGVINGKSIGLYYKNELVSLLVYGKSRFNKKYDVEVLRFCNKKYTIVTGGLSKLISKVKGKIISYCDLRYSNGVGYQQSGFNFVEKTNPNYWYYSGRSFDKYDGLQSRMKFQKHKLPELLETYDPNLTEWENMQLNGYNRIWDCGNLVFERINS